MKAMPLQDSLSIHMSPNPVVAEPDATLDEALALLERYGFRHLPVVESDRLVGILSDRDLRLATGLLPAAQRLVADEEGERLEGATRVSEIMHVPVHSLPPDATPAEAARDMVKRRIGAIPILEEDGELLGIVTETDLLQAFLELCRVHRGACDDLARRHMHEPLQCVGPDAHLEEALDAMAPRVGHLGVVDEEGRLVGILSERDLLGGLARSSLRDARAEAEGRMEDNGSSVALVMTRDVLSVPTDATLSRCAERMVGCRISAVPVVDAGRPLGILTQRDVLEYYAHVV